MLTLLTACTMQNNPLLMESTLPYGAPQFDKISEEHYIPAFRQAVKEGKAEIDAIVNNREAPSFSNTIEALVYAGSALNKPLMATLVSVTPAKAG